MLSLMLHMRYDMDLLALSPLKRAIVVLDRFHLGTNLTMSEIVNQDNFYERLIDV